MLNTNIVNGEKVHTVKELVLTGSIQYDVETMCRDEVMRDFLWGVLETCDLFTDGKVTYCGSDIQDHLE